MDLTALRQLLEAHPEIELAVVFGSTVTGKAGPRSDVDLAIRLSSSPGPWALGGLAMEVERATGRRADIVLFEPSLSTLLRHEISKGMLLKGSREDWIEFRRRTFREWREFEPRFHRIHAAHARRWLKETDQLP